MWTLFTKRGFPDLYVEGDYAHERFPNIFGFKPDGWEEWDTDTIGPGVVFTMQTSPDHARARFKLLTEKLLGEDGQHT